MKLRSYNYKSTSPAPFIGALYNDKGKLGNICTRWGMSAALNTGNHQEHWTAEQKTLREVNTAWAGPACLEITLYWVLLGQLWTKKFIASSLDCTRVPTESGCREVRGPGPSRKCLSMAACDQQQKSSSVTCEMGVEKAVPFVAQCQD